MILTIAIRLPNQTPLATLHAWPDLSLLIYRLLDLDIMSISCIVDSRTILALSLATHVAHDMAAVMVCVGQVVHVGAVAASAGV